MSISETPTNEVPIIFVPSAPLVWFGCYATGATRTFCPAVCRTRLPARPLQRCAGSRVDCICAGSAFVAGHSPHIRSGSGGHLAKSLYVNTLQASLRRVLAVPRFATDVAKGSAIPVKTGDWFMV